MNHSNKLLKIVESNIFQNFILSMKHIKRLDLFENQKFLMVLNKFKSTFVYFCFRVTQEALWFVRFPGRSSGSSSALPHGETAVLKQDLPESTFGLLTISTGSTTLLKSKKTVSRRPA